MTKLFGMIAVMSLLAFGAGCELEKTHTGDTYIFNADDGSAQVNQLYNDDGNNAQAALDDTSHTATNGVTVVVP